MVRIANLIRNDQSQIQSDCELIVSGDTSVREAFAKMQQYGCDCIGIGTDNDDKAVILSKEDILQGLLSELDRAQQHLDEMSRQIKGSMADQLDIVQDTVKTLADSERNKLEVAIANMTEGLIILGTTGQLERANPPAKKLLGLGVDDDLETVMKTIDELGLRELILDSDGNNPSKWGEFKIKVAGGRVLQMRWTEMLNECEQTLGNVVVVRNITDEMAADRAKAEFIAAISHELRTPLTSLQNSVSNILAGVTGKVSKKTRRYLHTMKSDCHRFADLVNDLLDMAKLDAGNMPINREVMHIEAIIGDAMKAFAEEAKAKDIELVCEIDRHISPVYADPRRICQVLRNLVSNAVKFTNPEGRVCIRSFDNDDNVITMVEDTGVGISPELQKQIFSKFYQISRQVGPGYHGSGLGLAICDGIIAVHGGSIWVESDQGTGSKFYFSLPKTDPFIVLYKHLDALAEKALKRAEKFAVIITNFDVPSEKRDELKDIVDGLISEILAQRNRFMNNSEGLAIQTEDFEVVFVIKGSEKRHVEAVKREIQKIVRNKLRKNCGKAPILPMLGMAVYPTDSCEAGELEKIARHASKKIT